MTINAFCQHRSTLLMVSAAIESAGVTWKQPQTNPNLFLTNLATEQPCCILITTDNPNDPHLFAEARRIAPNARIVFCLSSDVNTVDTLWPILDALEFDVLCQLHELTNCLTALKADRFYKSALLTTHPAYHKKESLPGWHTITTAEKRVLALMLQGFKGPAIADKLCISSHTVNNEKASITQKLGVSGGPGSLINFVLLNAEKLRRLLAA